MRVVFYISGHGYGHAMRMTAVMNALAERCPEVRLFIRTLAPEWVFAANVLVPFEYARCPIDPGVVEEDAYGVDVAATLHQWQEARLRSADLVRREMAFLRAVGVDLVVSDVPPLASVIAAEARTPVVAVTNFSWDFIFAPWLDRMPGYADLVAWIRDCYAATNLLLRLPWSPELDAFPRRESVPLLARRFRGDPTRVRMELEALAPIGERRLILLGGRFVGLEADAVRRVLASGRYALASFAPAPVPDLDGYLHLGREWQSRYVEVLSACDVVMSKLGYGVASECAAAGIPLLHPPRHDFAEEPLVRAGLPEWIPSLGLSRSSLESGEWETALDRLLAQPFVPERPPADGADVIATRLLAIAGGMTWPVWYGWRGSGGRAGFEDSVD